MTLYQSLIRHRRWGPGPMLIHIVDFARQSGRLDEVLADSTLVSLEGAGHMIHHSAPEKVVDGINLAASRSGIAENNQSLPIQQPITVDPGQKEATVQATIPT